MLQVLEVLREYSGLLSTFPEMINVHKVKSILIFFHFKLDIEFVIFAINQGENRERNPLRKTPSEN